MATSRTERERTAGFATLQGGMNSGVSPLLLDDFQYALGLNTSIRGSFAKTRPGFVRQALIFESESIQEAFEGGRFQRAHSYLARDGRSYLVAQISGRLYSVNLSTLNVQDITGSSPGNPVVSRVWMSQGENYLVVNDGDLLPWIFDGTTTRRSEGGLNSELQPGTVTAYVNGRFWYAVADSKAFRAGDLVGGSSGDPAIGRRDSILKETENTYLNEGGDFAIPYQTQVIHGMVPVPQLDTSLGYGPLQVFTGGGIFSVNAPVDRTTWKDVDFPIQTQSMLDSGATSQEAIVQVNGDIFYRARDGVRSFLSSRRDFQSWGQGPQSREMNRILERDSLSLLQYASGEVFDNRLLFTTHPVKDDGHGVYHRGMVSLDFEPVKALGLRTAPVWDSLWTGIQPFQILKGEANGEEKLYAFSFNSDEERIELWQITSDRDGVCFDMPSDTEEVRIPWTIETKDYVFDSTDSMVKLNRVELWVDQVQGELDLRISYRPDDYPCWTTWGEKEKCQLHQSCPDGSDCYVFETLRPAVFTRLAFGAPASTCLSGREQPSSVGYHHQFRIHALGCGRIKLFKAVAHQVSENKNAVTGAL